MPAVSPNKTIEGSLGGILSAVAVTVIYMIVDRSVAGGHGFLAMIFFTILFSIAGQFGDLVESCNQTPLLVSRILGNLFQDMAVS